jgi:tetratricopeptide (TPR) repeat protein
MPARRLGCLTLALAVCTGSAVAQEIDPFAQAETLFAAGKKDEAARLLDSVSAKEPGNVRAARRAAEIYWSMGWGDTSVQRLDALANQVALDRETALQRAHYLHLTGKTQRAHDEYAKLVESQPADKAARLGLAQTLTTLNKRGRARAEARTVLASAPHDPEALTVMGKTYLWTSDAVHARAWFNRALAVDADYYPAKLGLAELDSGADPAYASPLLAELQAKRPNDSWLRTLSSGVDKAAPPTFTGVYDNFSTDDLEIENWVMRGQRKLARGRNMDFAYVRNNSRYGATAPSAHVDAGVAQYQLPVAPGQRLTFTGGVAKRTDTRGESDAVAVGQFGWTWGNGRAWEGSVDVGRRPYALGLDTLESSVMENSASAGLTAHVPGGLAAKLSGSVAKVAPQVGDSTTRWSILADVARSWPLGGVVPVSLGYTFSHTEHAESIQSLGYFAPLTSTGNSLYAAVAGAVPPRQSGKRLEFVLSARYNFLSYDKVDDESFTGQLGLRFHTGNGLQLVFAAGRSDGSLKAGFPASKGTQISGAVVWEPSRKPAK